MKNIRKNTAKTIVLTFVLLACELFGILSDSSVLTVSAASGGQTASSDVLNVVLTTSGSTSATMGSLSESTYTATNNTAGQQRGTIALDNASVGGHMHVNIGQEIDMYAPAADVDYTDVIGFAGNYAFKAAGGMGGYILASDRLAGSAFAAGGYGSVITNSLIDYNTGQSITYRKGSNGRSAYNDEATNTINWDYTTSTDELRTYMGDLNCILAGETPYSKAYSVSAQVGSASYIQVSDNQYIVAGGGAPGAVVFEHSRTGGYAASGSNGAHADNIPDLPEGADGFDNPVSTSMTVHYRDFGGTQINANRIAGTAMRTGVPISSAWGGGVCYEDIFCGWTRGADGENKGVSSVYPGYSGLASRDGSLFNPEGLDNSAYNVSIDSSAMVSEPYLKLTCNAKYITISHPTRTGYTFAGWTCGTGVSVVSSDASSTRFKVTSSGATITANWVQNVYTIAYDANGGTGTMSSHTVVAEGTFTLQNNGFTAPSGYIFDDAGYAVVRASDNAVFCGAYGWQPLTGSIGSNPANWQRYPQGSSWIMNDAWYNPNRSARDTFVFCAQWKLATYYIEYQKGQTDWSGTGPQKTTCIYNQDVTLSGIGNIKGRSYTLMFDSNKGSGSSTPTTVSSLTGYLSGSGWKIESNTYDFGAILTKPNFATSGTVTATAQWQNKTLNNFPTVSREGYQFLGWYDAPEGGNLVTSVTVTPGTTAFTQTLYAHWKANDYTITYDEGDTDDTDDTLPEDTPCNYDEDVTLPDIGDLKGRSYVLHFDSNKGNGSSEPTIVDSMSGYLTADGWLINNGVYGFGTTIIRPNFTAEQNGLVTATPNWQDVILTNFSAVSRNGYQFLGWYDAPEGGNLVTSVTVTPDKTAFEQTLYAHWEVNTYTIVFSPNGGEEITSLESVDMDYDATITIPDGAQYYVKYTLDGVNITREVLDGTINIGDEEGSESENNEGTEENDRRTDKAAYASVYKGWSLEDGKDGFTPRWLAGETISVSAIASAAGVANTNGAVITLYATWDDSPWILASDRYFTLNEARSGVITPEELFRTATANDIEDGTLRPDAELTLLNYDSQEFIDLYCDAVIQITYQAVDSEGSVYQKIIYVHVIDDVLEPDDGDDGDNDGDNDNPDDDPEHSDSSTDPQYQQQTFVRFISSDFWQNEDGTFVSEENGGVATSSVWRTDTAKTTLLTDILNNAKHDETEKEITLAGQTFMIKMPGTGTWDYVQSTWVFTPEDVAASKAFIAEHGWGNYKEADGLQQWYDEFSRCRQ